MICKNCQTENNNSASFCIKCGYELKEDSQASSGKNNYSDTIIIIISIFLMFTKLFWLVFSRFYSENWQVLRHFSNFFNLIWAAIPLLLAFVVKNKVWKIILIVMGGIYALLSMIDIFRDISQSFINFNF